MIKHIRDTFHAKPKQTKEKSDPSHSSNYDFDRDTPLREKNDEVFVTKANIAFNTCLFTKIITLHNI